MATDTDNESKRKRQLTLLAAAVAVILLGASLEWLFWGRFHQETDDAYVNGNVIAVSARINGSVTAIHADDTDRVNAGDLLIQMDDTDTRVALDEARSTLAKTLREVSALFAQTRQLKANWEQAQSDYARAQQLERSHNISSQDLQRARTQLDAAKAGYDAARARIEGTSVGAHPQVKLALAHLKNAWLAQQRTRILAPAAGYVAQRRVQVGQQVAAGTPLLAVVPLDHLWVDANFKETQIRDLRIGQPAEVEADVYGSSFTFHGRVEGIAAGTGSAFSLLPPQNATGNWIKVVQRLPVRISLDPAELKEHPLRIGLSMLVTVNTHDRDGAMLMQAPESAVRFSTDIYQEDTRSFDQLVAQIFQQNGVAVP